MRSTLLATRCEKASIEFFFCLWLAQSLLEPTPFGGGGPLLFFSIWLPVWQWMQLRTSQRPGSMAHGARTTPPPLSVGNRSHPPERNHLVWRVSIFDDRIDQQRYISAAHRLVTGSHITTIPGGNSGEEKEKNGFRLQVPQFFWSGRNCSWWLASPTCPQCQCNQGPIYRSAGALKARNRNRPAGMHYDFNTTAG